MKVNLVSKRDDGQLVALPPGQGRKPPTLSCHTPGWQHLATAAHCLSWNYQAFSQQTFQKTMTNWSTLVLPPIKLMQYCCVRNYSQMQLEKAELLNDKVTGENKLKYLWKWSQGLIANGTTALKKIINLCKDSESLWHLIHSPHYVVGTLLRACADKKMGVLPVLSPESRAIISCF